MAKPGSLYPLPVQTVFNHPGYVNLPAAGRGMLLSLLENYWRGGCRWFPSDGLQQSQLARAHLRSWSLHKTAILEIFAAARPELDAYHARREAAHKGLVNAQAAATSTQRLNALRENTARAQGRRLDLASAGMTPRREPNATPRPIAPDKREARPRFTPKV